MTTNHQAELQALELEEKRLVIAKAKADIDVAIAEKAKTEAEARAALIRADEYEHNHRIRSQEDDMVGVYRFGYRVDDNTVRHAILATVAMARSGQDRITVVLNSPGGSVIAGFALLDHLLGLREQGIELTMHAFGMAASMAGILLQAGSPGRRLVTPHAHLLIHEVSSLASGKTSELEDELAFLRRLQAKALAMLAERSTLTERQIANRWRKTDWWLDAAESVELGFADEVSW